MSTPWSAVGQAWARSALSDPDLFNSDVVDELNELRDQNIEPVFVSGSFMEVLAPIAGHLGVKEILAISLLQSGGKYTGRIASPQTIGEGKAAAIAAFLMQRTAYAADCWAFGDDESDLPIMWSTMAELRSSKSEETGGHRWSQAASGVRWGL